MERISVQRACMKESFSPSWTANVAATDVPWTGTQAGTQTPRPRKLMTAAGWVMGLVAAVLALSSRPAEATYIGFECDASPRSDCYDASKASLKMGYGSVPKLSWKWKGSVVDVGIDDYVDVFGVPNLDTYNAFCLYEGATLQATILIPAAEEWTEKSSGFVYDNKYRNEDGVSKVKLAWKQGVGTLGLKGLGGDLGLPLDAQWQQPTVQFTSSRSDGACWSATGTLPVDVKGDGTVFIDKCGSTENPCTPAPARQTKIVFVTSDTYTGSLGGAAGADSACQDVADAAGLTGIFQAWMSEDYSNPYQRFTHSTEAAYTLVDGTKIADNWADLNDGTIDHVINLDENGTTVSPAAFVFTGTSGNGGPATDNCENWSSNSAGSRGAMGGVAYTDSNWTEYDALSPYPCSVALRMYCFQQ